MSGSLNKVMIIGNLGRDPEIRHTQDGRPIANLRIATTDKWRDQSGSQQEKTEWHTVVVFGKLAEICQQYLKKGQSAYFEGRLQTRKWTGQDGQDRYTTEIVVDQRGSMQMLGSRGGASMSEGSYDQSAGMDSSFDQSAPAAGAMKPATVSEDAAFDDDIPF